MQVCCRKLKNQVVKATQTIMITDKNKACVCFDLMALIQSTEKLARTCNTFGEYGLKLLEIILAKSASVLCIDIVGDRYLKSSINAGERSRRSKFDGIATHIHGPQTHISKQWEKFVCIPEN